MAEKRSDRRPDRKPEKRPEGATTRRLEERLSRRSETGERKREDERSRRTRLDTPRDLRRPLMRRPTIDPDRFGRFAEQFARFMGTASFLIWMTLFVVFWVVWNLLAPTVARFDNYPFIFLTLILSLQASYAAPLILLAQNRQEVRDRVITEQDRQANTRAHADMEFLAREVASLRMALGEVATRDYLRSELRGLLGDLDERARENEAERTAQVAEDFPEVVDGDGGGDREPGEIRAREDRPGPSAR